MAPASGATPLDERGWAMDALAHLADGVVDVHEAAVGDDPTHRDGRGLAQHRPELGAS
jgi:hypothetical protein